MVHRTASLEEQGGFTGPVLHRDPRLCLLLCQLQQVGEVSPSRLQCGCRGTNPHGSTHAPTEEMEGAEDLSPFTSFFFSQRKLPSLQASLARIGSTVQLQDLGREVSLISSLYCREKRCYQKINKQT